MSIVSKAWKIKFDGLLREELIPDFCQQKSKCLPEGFKEDSNRLEEEDCRYFLLAWESGIVRRVAPGKYQGPIESVVEHFFNHGPKSIEPRPYFLALEPFITFAALARLHYDHNWPTHCLATQSTDWAFDAVAYRPQSDAEHIAGEIKTTEQMMDRMIESMVDFGGRPEVQEPPSGPLQNAYRKVVGLRKRQAPIFWALGPSGYSRVFRVEYADDGFIKLAETDAAALDY